MYLSHGGRLGKLLGVLKESIWYTARRKACGGNTAGCGTGLETVVISVPFSSCTTEGGKGGSGVSADKESTRS